MIMILYIEKLNNLENVRIKRPNDEYNYKRPDGKIEKHEKQNE